jgi:hypothetical protein
VGRACRLVVTGGSSRAEAISHAHAIPGAGLTYTALACTFQVSGALGWCGSLV